MSDWVVQVDLSEQGADFRRLALQPGMGLIDRGGAHTAILRKWLGSYLAEPAWDGQFVRFQIRAEDGPLLHPKNFQPLSAADCKGAFRSEIDVIAQKLEAAPARTGTERALRHVMLERLKKLQADPKLASASGAFAKYLDPAGIWRLVWLWGFERKTSDPASVAVCKKPGCRSLTLITEDRRSCPACGTKLKTARSPVPVLSVLLLLILFAGGAGYWFTRPPAEVAGSIEGQVFSALGQKPIAGAKVQVEGSETEVQTDTDGRFELKELDPETAILRISAPGFHEETLEAKSTASPRKVWLRGKARLTGSVRDQINNTPLAGARISLPAWGISTRTDAEGKFEIADVPGGKIAIEASAAGFEAKTLEHTLAENRSEPVEFQLAGQGKLVGAVIDALTLKPVPGAMVFLLNTPLTATTDETGRFEIAGISTGAATIAVQAAGYQAEHTDQVLEATEVRPFLVGLHGAGLIRGRVVAKADGRPLAGAGVEISHPDYSRSVKTNARGEFELQKLPPGPMDLRVTLEGFREALSQTLPAMESEPIEIPLVGDASLSGIVTDAVEKKPIPDVEVRIAGTELSAKTGEDGKFHLPEVPGRNATVEVVGRGYRQVELPQTFEPGQESELSVELKGGTILSGRVVDASTRSPIAGAEVVLTGTEQKARTDTGGRFRFEDLAAGKKALNVNVAGYASAEAETELKTDQESTLEIALNGDAAVSGSVVRSGEETPLAGVRVKLAGSPRETATDDNGRFRLENVPSGLRELEVTREGYQTGRVSRDLVSGVETEVEIALKGSAVLTGTIIDPDGHPLDHAMVTTENPRSSAGSDEEGRFRLEGLPPGEVDAVISAKGFQPERKTVSIDAGGEPVSLGELVLRPIAVDPAEVARPFESAPEGVIVTDGTGEGFRNRLDRAGAKTGDVQVSLAWDNGNDIDLHVQAPSGEVIYFGHRNSECGGELDVDMNADGPDTSEPVENIYWPLNSAPRGKYKVLAHHYANHGAADPTDFRVAVKNGDEVKYYTGKLDPHEKVVVCEFERLAGPDPVKSAGTHSPSPNNGQERSPNPMPSGDQGKSEGKGEAGEGKGESGEGKGESGEGKEKKRPPVYNRTNEEQASQRLKLAEDLLDLNKPDAAKRWLKDVAERYPDTKAGRRSQKLLDQLSDGASSKTDTGDGIYLANLTPVRTNVGGELQTRPVQIAGEEKRHGLWTRTNVDHPPASVEYALGQRYAHLSGAVGIDDTGQADRTRVSTTFQIVGDGKVLWSSDPLREPGKSQTFQVDVSQVNNLKILAESNNLPSHYAVWDDPWLLGPGDSE